MNETTIQLTQLNNSVKRILTDASKFNSLYELNGEFTIPVNNFKKSTNDLLIRLSELQLQNDVPQNITALMQNSLPTPKSSPVKAIMPGKNTYTPYATMPFLPNKKYVEKFEKISQVETYNTVKRSIVIKNYMKLKSITNSDFDVDICNISEFNDIKFLSIDYTSLCKFPIENENKYLIADNYYFYNVNKKTNYLEKSVINNTYQCWYESE